MHKNEQKTNHINIVPLMQLILWMHGLWSIIETRLWHNYTIDLNRIKIGIHSIHVAQTVEHRVSNAKVMDLFNRECMYCNRTFT